MSKNYVITAIRHVLQTAKIDTTREIPWSLLESLRSTTPVPNAVLHDPDHADRTMGQSSDHEIHPGKSTGGTLATVPNSTQYPSSGHTCTRDTSPWHKLRVYRTSLQEAEDSAGRNTSSSAEHAAGAADFGQRSGTTHLRAGICGGKESTSSRPEREASQPNELGDTMRLELWPIPLPPIRHGDRPL